MGFSRQLPPLSGSRRGSRMSQDELTLICLSLWSDRIWRRCSRMEKPTSTTSDFDLDVLILPQRRMEPAGNKLSGGEGRQRSRSLVLTLAIKKRVARALGVDIEAEEEVMPAPHRLKILFDVKLLDNRRRC